MPVPHRVLHICSDQWWGFHGLIGIPWFVVTLGRCRWPCCYTIHNRSLGVSTLSETGEYRCMQWWCERPHVILVFSDHVGHLCCYRRPAFPYIGLWTLNTPTSWRLQIPSLLTAHPPYPLLKFISLSPRSYCCGTFVYTVQGGYTSMLCSKYSSW